MKYKGKTLTLFTPHKGQDELRHVIRKRRSLGKVLRERGCETMSWKSVKLENANAVFHAKTKHKIYPQQNVSAIFFLPGTNQFCTRN